MASLAISERDYEPLFSHLITADRKEAAAILICGRTGIGRDRLCVRKTILIPHDACLVRTSDRISWPGEHLEQAIDHADTIDGSIVLIHSHPSGYFEFSSADNASDAITIPSLMHGVVNADARHGSAIMVPDGRIKLRLYTADMISELAEKIYSIGHNIRDLTKPTKVKPVAFTAAMTRDLRRMVVCVVGVSGTGSIVAEILARLGVGTLILIDFDRVEEKNLNRIIYATPEDIGKYKTHVLRDAIRRCSPSTKVVTLETSIAHHDTLVAVSGSDTIFSCVDSFEGRYYCDLASQTFICPLIDIGVTVPTREDAPFQRAILDVCGRIDYVYPGGSTLWDRGQITAAALSAEYKRRVDPVAYQREIEEGYISGLPEEAPTVISLNMRASSAGVNEWLARLYEYRHDSNSVASRCFFSLAARDEEYESEPAVSGEVIDTYGQGLKSPLLGLPDLQPAKEQAA